MSYINKYRINLDTSGQGDRYARGMSAFYIVILGNKKGVTAHHRNPWFSLWWRRGDLNSRPPPCEGDALPAELLPHMDATTRRSEVCMPFICRGQVFFVHRPPVVRERRACYPWHARAGQLRSRLRQVGAPTCTSDRQDGDVVMFAARSGCFQSVFSLVCRQASSSFPGTPAGKLGRSEAGWYTNALPVRTQGHPRAVSSGRQPSRHAGQSPWHPRVLSFRHP